MGEVHAATHRWTMRASRLHSTSGNIRSTDASKYPVRHGIAFGCGIPPGMVQDYTLTADTSTLSSVCATASFFSSIFDRARAPRKGGCRRFSINQWGRWLCHCQSERPAAALRARHGRRRVKPRLHRLGATDCSRRCRLLRTTSSAYARSAIIARTRPGHAP